MQSLILSTAVPTIIGFSLWREVRLPALFLSSLRLWTIQMTDVLCTALLCVAVLPPCLSGSVWTAGVLRPRYSGADQLDQVIRLCFLFSVLYFILIVFRMCINEIYKMYKLMSSFSCCVTRLVFTSSRSQAPVAAVFAGSPQLLGTVKLCSGSAVTTLPLYSDINLLRRSEDVSDQTLIESIPLKRKHLE